MKTWFLRIALALVAILALALPAGAQNPVNITVTQVDQSRFPQMDVYISVTDAAGNPVKNLAPDAFQLTENGQPMALSAATRAGEQNPLSVVLVVDHSGSMNTANKMSSAKLALATFVNQMRPGDQTALIQFDTEIDTLQPFTNDKSALLNAIQKIVPRGNTALYDSLMTAAKYFEAATGRKAVIVVTDGMDNVSKANRDEVVAQAIKNGFSIYTIGLGAKSAGYGSQDGIDEASLKIIGKGSNGDYFYAPDASQLNGLYQTLSLRLQNEYKLTYVSSGLRDGVKRNIVVTAPGAGSTSTAYNPGGVIPEVAFQWTSWVLFAVLLVLLIGLFFAPAVLRLAREGGMPELPGLPTLAAAQSKPKPKIKLTGEATPPGSASRPSSTGSASGASQPAATPRPSRIKVGKKPPAAGGSGGSDVPHTQMPWDEGAPKH